MVKNKVVLEIKINERSYQMECYGDSPLGEIYDALCRMRAFVVDRMVEENKKSETKEEPPLEG